MSGLVGGCPQGSHAVTPRLATSPCGSSSGSFKQRHGNMYAYAAPLRTHGCWNSVQQQAILADSTVVAVPCQAWQIKGSRGHQQLTSRAVRPVVKCSSTHGWGCASPVCCHLSSSSSSMRDQQMPPSRPSRVCAAHAAAAAAAIPAVVGNPWWPARQPAAARLRSPATSGEALEAVTAAADGTLHPASSTSDEVPSSSALPDDFWEERRKLLRSMRHERDPVNKRARFKAVREAEQARLARMTPQQQAAYEEEMRALRIAGIAAQRAALENALATGLRVVIDCEYAVPKQGCVEPDRARTDHLTQTSDSTAQNLEAGGGDDASGSNDRSSSSSEGQGAAQRSAKDLSPEQQAEQPEQQFYPQLDVAWGDGGIHHDKEIRSLAKQIEASMSMNRRSSRPVALTVTSFDGPLANFANHIGASSWPLNKHAAPLLEVFPASECVFLSPDADEPLLQLDPDKVYVVGGIVDRSVRKGLTLGKAERHGLAAVRLPVLEYAKYLNLDGPSASNRPVLNVTDVVVALVEFARTGDWVHALRAAVPARKQRGGSGSSSSSRDEG